MLGGDKPGPASPGAVRTFSRHGHTASLALLVVWVVVLSTGFQEVRYVVRRGNHLAEITFYSEANAIRAGEGYAKRGFLLNAGLPDTVFGDQFRESGHAAELPGLKSLIYTHYPPGPDWMAGIATLLFGKGHIALFRIFPLSVGMAGIGFFAWNLVRALGPPRAALALLACARAPMFGNMMHVLHYQGYAFALLLAQAGLLLRVFVEGRALTRRALIGCACLGFVQGWLSFDYFFLVALVGVPLWLLGSGEEWRSRWRDVLWCVAAPCAGFAAAHALHFVQVAGYYGSFATAVRDLWGSAIYRAVGPDLLSVLRAYYRIVSAKWGPLGSLIRPITIVTVALAVTGRGTLSFGRMAPSSVSWSVPVRHAAAVIVGLMVSCLWISVMRNHGIVHTHFLPRHFFLYYLCCLLLIVRGTSWSRDPGRVGAEASG